MASVQRIRNGLLQVRIWADSIRADVQGQDLIEYALMAGFVAVTSGALMPGVAANISRIFSNIASVMTNSKNQGS
jgi:pilus assembly protein Flp/PilA